MSHTDLIIVDNIIHLDKVYKIRFSMRSLYRLEQRYGNVNAAFSALEEMQDIRKYIKNFAFILSTMIKADRTEMEKQLSPENIPGIFAVMMKTIADHSMRAQSGRNTAESGTDWDFLLFTARFRLNMTEREFWECTPRKFGKMTDLYVDMLSGKRHRNKLEQLRRLEAAGL